MPARLMLVLLAAALSRVALAAGAPAAASDAFDRGQTLFAEARELEKTKSSEHDEIARRYGEAAESFAAAWKAGAATTEVFTNAANCHYFARDTGKAVLFYRRALSIDPMNRRAREALEHVRTSLPIKKPAAGAAASIAGSLFFWHTGLAFGARKAIFLATFLSAFACFTAALFRKRPFLLIGILLLVPAVALLGSILVSAFTDSTRADAVVLVEAAGRLGDGLMYSPSHSRPFPPGTEVTIIAVRRSSDGGVAGGEPWAHVRLLDGLESWVPERTIEKVLP